MWVSIQDTVLCFWSKGALPKCTTIAMDGNPASAEAKQGVKDAIANCQ